MPMLQIVPVTRGALLVVCLSASLSLQRVGAYPTLGSAGSCETVGNTAPCHCICRCDGDVVGAKTFAADELTAQGDGYCSTTGTDLFTAPCVQFCFNHTGSCGNTFEDNPVGMTCTSIGDLPEVTAPLASSAVALAAGDAYPTLGSADTCETVGNTAPCHCICRCDGDVVGAKTFAADELTAQGDGYCSTTGTDFFTAPCVQFCFNHTGSCGNTFEDNPVGMTCTSIGDLPDVPMSWAVSVTVGAAFLSLWARKIFLVVLCLGMSKWQP